MKRDFWQTGQAVHYELSGMEGERKRGLTILEVC